MNDVKTFLRNHKAELGGGLIAGLAAAVPIAVALLTATDVKTRVWLLGLLGAVLAGIAAGVTVRQTKKSEEANRRELKATKEAAEASGRESKEAADALREQIKNAEAQRAETATALTVVAGALTNARRGGSGSDRYPASLAETLRQVLPAESAPLRVAFLARGAKDAGKGPLLSVQVAVGHHPDVSWQIAPDTDDAVVANSFDKPPWTGALLIDDTSAAPYRIANVLVLKPPESDVISYCRAEVKAGKQFGLLCVDSWAQDEDSHLREADKTVVEAFAGMLAIGLALIESPSATAGAEKAGEPVSGTGT